MDVQWNVISILFTSILRIEKAKWMKKNCSSEFDN